MSAPTTSVDLQLREIGADDFPRVWPIFHTVVAAGDTYSYPPDLSLEQACAWWATPPSRCFIAEREGEVLGCYMLRPNQPGLGDHVANAGYMVSPGARGQGIAGRMCEHSMQQARAAGFTAMQFNFWSPPIPPRCAYGSATVSRLSDRYLARSAMPCTARLTFT